MADLRHTYFSKEPATLVVQLAENARDTNEALGERIKSRIVRIGNYSATGATTTRLKIPARVGSTPIAVLLVRAYPESDPGADLTIAGRVNFTQPDASTLAVYEPSGLTLNTTYNLTFLVLE